VIRLPFSLRHAGLALGLLGIVAASDPALASDSFASEASHAAGGAAIAGTLTYFADHYRPQYRGWIGFSASVAMGIALEGLDAANGNGFSGLDALSHALGAAAGAFVTDQYILAPVVKPEGKQGAYLGVQARVAF